MMIDNRKAVRNACLCLVLLLLIAPYVSASVDPNSIPVNNTHITDNSQNMSTVMIPALRLHTAYLGQSQKARMDGVIAYIDNISGRAGTERLRQIEDDYLDIASTIPLMTTNDEISSARDDMRTQTRLFSDETNAQFAIFNGSTGDMRASIGSSVQGAGSSFANSNDSLWLSRPAARLTLFDVESEQRALLLRSLGRQGVDTNLTRNISDQIDALRPDLQGALSNNSLNDLMTVNTGFRQLNIQFRTEIDASRAAYAIELQRQAAVATQ